MALKSLQYEPQSGMVVKVYDIVLLYTRVYNSIHVHDMHACISYYVYRSIYYQILYTHMSCLQL